MDFKSRNHDVIEVKTFRFNSKVFTKVKELQQFLYIICHPNVIIKTDLVLNIRFVFNTWMKMLRKQRLPEV